MKKIVLFAIILLLYNRTTAQVPVITLVSPSSKDRTNISGLTLIKAEIVSNSFLREFRVINNDMTVVNEQNMIAEKKDSITYIIECNIPLKKGWNTICVEARNPYGKAISEKRSINCRPEPYINWIFPKYNNTNMESGIVNIKVEIKSGYELKNLSININGTESAIQLAGITSENDSTYIFEKVIQLSPGVNRIYLIALNEKGKTMSITRYIYWGIAYLKRNAIYGTLGIGPIYGTLLGNYEHSIYQSFDKFFPSIRARIGVGPWALWEGTGVHYIATVQALSGKRKGHLEIGAGAVLIQEYTNYSIWPAGNLGYRFQKPDGSGLFRIGIGFPEALYLSFGFSF
jgi:hypothetical protein